jgi:glyoxylase I family protein
MLHLKQIHHIAIICSDYEKSKAFYTSVLGLQVIREVYRADRKSYKLDLAVNNNYCIELFSFENPPKRNSFPEACGLRHLAFAVENLSDSLLQLDAMQIQHEGIREDVFTNKQFTFFADPDGLPIELYEI